MYVLTDVNVLVVQHWQQRSAYDDPLFSTIYLIRPGSAFSCHLRVYHPFAALRILGQFSDLS